MSEKKKLNISNTQMKFIRKERHEVWQQILMKMFWKNKKNQKNIEIFLKKQIEFVRKYKWNKISKNKWRKFFRNTEIKFA